MRVAEIARYDVIDEGFLDDPLIAFRRDEAHVHRADAVFVIGVDTHELQAAKRQAEAIAVSADAERRKADKPIAVEQLSYSQFDAGAVL
ncbi:MAG TPA: hypothetical protein PLD46_07190, partial [Hyphomicrobium sp.]|nr:hypothetical protein [Hyphomicrobium sp.]